MNEQFERILEKFKKPSRKDHRKRFLVNKELLEKMKKEWEYLEEFLWARARKLSCACVPYGMVHRLNPEPTFNTLQKLSNRKKKQIEKWEKRLEDIDRRF